MSNLQKGILLFVAILAIVSLGQNFFSDFNKKPNYERYDNTTHEPDKKQAVQNENIATEKSYSNKVENSSVLPLKTTPINSNLVDEPSPQDSESLSDTTRSKESIKKIVMGKISELKYIYNEYLKSNPDFAGKIVVKMVIAPSGNIIKVDLLESSFHNLEFENAILDKMRTWKFNAITKGTATVVYPFNFSS